MTHRSSVIANPCRLCRNVSVIASPPKADPPKADLPLKHARRSPPKADRRECHPESFGGLRTSFVEG
ncbi:MAG: hypothetical protein ACP5JH_11990 [Bacteroidota bacterium]